MKLNYKKMGEGQPLLILHGVFGSLDNWMTLGKRFSEDFEVWLIDQRNHGHSPHSEEMSYPTMAKDLKNFIDQQQLENAIVLGHSMGGKVAMEFAIKYPDSLEKLIIADISPESQSNHFDGIIEGLLAVEPSTIEDRKEAEEKLAEYVPQKAVRQFLLKNLHRKENGNYEWRFNLKVIADKMDEISKWQVEDGEFKKPVLFLKGEKSDYIEKKDERRMKELFPSFELKEIPSAGHWLHAEKPDDFYEEVSVFAAQQ